MAINPEQFGTMAMQLMEDMEREYGADASVTAMLTVVAEGHEGAGFHPIPRC